MTGSPHLGQTATLGADSFQLEPRRLSRRALDTLHLGTAMVTPPWSNCFLQHSFWTYFSRSCFKAANRGSSSFWQLQGPSFRFLPQRWQIPLQSSLHSSLESRLRTKTVRTISSRSALSPSREYPLVFVLFVGQFRHQNHIDGEADFPAKISGASVAGAMDAGGDLTGHHENTRGVPHRAFRRDRLGHRVADTVTKITQVNACGKGNRRARTINDFRKPQQHTFPPSHSRA